MCVLLSYRLGEKRSSHAISTRSTVKPFGKLLRTPVGELFALLVVLLMHLYPSIREARWIWLAQKKNWWERPCYNWRRTSKLTRPTAEDAVRAGGRLELSTDPVCVNPPSFWGKDDLTSVFGEEMRRSCHVSVLEHTAGVHYYMSMIVLFKQGKARHEVDHEEGDRQLRICHDGTSNGDLRPATAKTSAKASFAQSYHDHKTVVVGELNILGGRSDFPVP